MIPAARESFAVGQIVPVWGWWGFYVEAVDAGASVKMTKTGTPAAVTLEHSTDGGETWIPFDDAGGTTITFARPGARACFRSGSNGNAAFASSTSAFHQFVFTGSVKAGGDIMSLLTRSDTIKSFSSNFAFTKLFVGAATLVDASPLVLSATTATNQCYRGMFSSCSRMVNGPKIAARTIRSECCREMFYGCSALKTMPELPATSLAQYCYYNMFTGCSALADGVVLPAGTLTTNCYNFMFQNCRSLKSIITNQTSFTGCTNWVQNVASGGTFTCPSALGTAATITRGNSACPSGWTVVNI